MRAFFTLPGMAHTELSSSGKKLVVSGLAGFVVET